MIIFYDRETFRKFVLKLKGENAFFQEYAKGVFDRRMIIYYEEIDYLKDKNKFDLKVKNSVHEFINIVNKKEIKIDIKNNS